MRYFKLLWPLIAFLACLAVSIIFWAPVHAGSMAVSGVSAQTIADRARNDLNESLSSGATLFWTPAMFVQWIDEAVKEIVNQTRCLETGVSTWVISSGVRSYAILTDSGASKYLDIEKVEYDMGLSGVTTKRSQIYDLTRVPFVNLNVGFEKGRNDPKTFALWNDTLYIFPIPRDAQSGTSLYIYKTLLPDGVTSGTSVIETPAYFDTAILNYVEAKAKFREHQNFDQFKKDASHFYEKINQYRKDIIRREVFAPNQ